MKSEQLRAVIANKAFSSVQIVKEQKLAKGGLGLRQLGYIDYGESEWRGQDKHNGNVTVVFPGMGRLACESPKGKH